MLTSSGTRGHVSGESGRPRHTERHRFQLCLWFQNCDKRETFRRVFSTKKTVFPVRGAEIGIADSSERFPGERHRFWTLRMSDDRRRGCNIYKTLITEERPHRTVIPQEIISTAMTVPVDLFQTRNGSTFERMRWLTMMTQSCT